MNKTNDSKTPVRTLGFSSSSSAKRLLLYLVYAEIVLLASIKFGAPNGQPPFSDAEVAAVQNEMFGSPPPLSAMSPLPNGILVFDEETNQTTVYEGEAQANFLFNLHNASRKPVVITSVRTSCGCTVAKVAQLPWILKPQQRGLIAVTMNVAGFAEKSAKEVTVYTDQGSKTLEVVAMITTAKKAR